LIFFLFSSTTAGAEVITSLWQVKKSDHFIVYFKETPPDYLDKLIRQAEIYYNSITEELGFTRFEGFWTWDKRCKIYLYPSAKEYQRATGRPAWSGASVNILERTINTYVFEKDFMEVVLPHEMGHLIFREFVGYRRGLPLWLDEGVACLQEKLRKEERLQTAKGLVMSGIYLRIQKLTEITDDNLVMPNLFYSEAASVVNFLLKRYGRDKFVDFCRKLSDAKTHWYTALKDVYGFKNLSEMNDEWVRFISD
jgi:hypothetical protein